jgi:hypothetical protein
MAQFTFFVSRLRKSIKGRHPGFKPPIKASKKILAEMPECTRDWFAGVAERWNPEDGFTYPNGGPCRSWYYPRSGKQAETERGGVRIIMALSNDEGVI